MSKKFAFAAICSKCNHIAAINDNDNLFLMLGNKEVCSNCGTLGEVYRLSPVYGKPFITKRVAITYFLVWPIKIEIIE
jgi:hypothetical protein